MFSFTADKPAYKLFSKEGKEVSYIKMIKQLSKADIVFIGELHNNPISHWLELEITKSLHKANDSKIILGAEMFEADNQLLLDEYLSGLIPAKKFEAEVRLWDNYKTDYKPLVSFAFENKLAFIATNIPRRYANLVFRKDFDGLNELSDQAKTYMAPLPIKYDPEVSCYANMLKMEGMPAHVTANLPKAQAAKDATMAYFIEQNLKKDHIFIHYNGAYHSDNFESIVWHLQNNPKTSKLKIMTVSTHQQADIDSLNDKGTGLADFVIAVPENMTTTY